MKRWIIITIWILSFLAVALLDFSSTGRAYYCYLAVLSAFTLGISFSFALDELGEPVKNGGKPKAGEK